MIPLNHQILKMSKPAMIWENSDFVALVLKMGMLEKMSNRMVILLPWKKKKMSIFLSLRQVFQLEICSTWNVVYVCFEINFSSVIIHSLIYSLKMLEFCVTFCSFFLITYQFDVSVNSFALFSNQWKYKDV